MGMWEAIVLGLVQGLTEFLPISSSAHLRIVGELIGSADPGAAFTAITQIGTETAVLLYFRHDIVTIVPGVVAGGVRQGRDGPRVAPRLARPRRPDGLVHRPRHRSRSSCSACCSRSRSRTRSATSTSSPPRSRCSPCSSAGPTCGAPSSACSTELTPRHAVLLRVRPGARAHPGRLPLRRHDHRGSAHGLHPRGGGAVLVPARGPRRARLGPLPAGQEHGRVRHRRDPERRRHARRDPRRVRRRLRGHHRLPQDRLHLQLPAVRGVPARPRRRRRGAARDGRPRPRSRPRLRPAEPGQDEEVRLDRCRPGPRRPSPSSPGAGARCVSATPPRAGSSQAAPGPRATLYVCGITPYDATHLGHAATYVAFDLLGRAWRDAGLEVRYASNVTDVDDPLLERATATGVDWRDLAVEQTALFAADMTALAVIPPDVYLGAVETVPDVVAAVETMLAAGAAYRVPLEAGAGGGDPSPGGRVRRPLGGRRVRRGVRAQPRAHGQAVRRARRRPGPRRQARPARPAAVAPRASGRAGVGRRHARHGTPRVARGVRGDRARRARPAVRRPGRRGGPAVPAPRDEHVARAGARRRPGGAGPRARRHGGPRRREDEQVPRQPGPGLGAAGAGRGPDGDPARPARPPLRARTGSGPTRTSTRATERLARWRTATAPDAGPDATGTLEAIRAALSDDLDAPRAVAAVDAWVAGRAGATSSAGETATVADDVPGAPSLVAAAVDALLGIRL